MFWDRFVELCAREGTKPNPLAASLGISSGAVTRWKNGSIPQDTTLALIAAHFGVTTDYLLGEGPQPIGFDDFTYAMHNESTSLTEEDKALLLAMARSLASRNRRDGDG